MIRCGAPDGLVRCFFQGASVPLPGLLSDAAMCPDGPSPRSGHSVLLLVFDGVAEGLAMSLRHETGGANGGNRRRRPGLRLHAAALYGSRVDQSNAITGTCRRMSAERGEWRVGPEKPSLSAAWRLNPASWPPFTAISFQVCSATGWVCQPQSRI